MNGKRYQINVNQGPLAPSYGYAEKMSLGAKVFTGVLIAAGALMLWELSGLGKK